LKPTKEINCLSALDYIINNENNKDYENEFRYLYVNVVLPEKKKNKDLIYKKREQPKYNSDLEELDDEIESLFNELNNDLRNDPSYNNLIKYLEKGITNSKEIKFYQKYVDNFKIFKELYKIRKGFHECAEKIKYEEEVSSKLKLIEEKYLYIKKEIEKFLKPNFEKYYEEWSKDKRVKDYGFKDLILDLKKLIPENEIINISK